MRWIEAKAEAIVKRRALYLSGDSTPTGLSTSSETRNGSILPVVDRRLKIVTPQQRT